MAYQPQFWVPGGPCTIMKIPHESSSLYANAPICPDCGLLNQKFTNEIMNQSSVLRPDLAEQQRVQEVGPSTPRLPTRTNQPKVSTPRTRTRRKRTTRRAPIGAPQPTPKKRTPRRRNQPQAFTSIVEEAEAQRQIGISRSDRKKLTQYNDAGQPAFRLGVGYPTQPSQKCPVPIVALIDQQRAIQAANANAASASTQPQAAPPQSNLTPGLIVAQARRKQRQQQASGMVGPANNATTLPGPSAPRETYYFFNLEVWHNRPAVDIDGKRTWPESTIDSHRMETKWFSISLSQVEEGRSLVDCLLEKAAVNPELVPDYYAHYAFQFFDPITNEPQHVETEADDPLDMQLACFQEAMNKEAKRKVRTVKVMIEQLDIVYRAAAKHALRAQARELQRWQSQASTPEPEVVRPAAAASAPLLAVPHPPETSLRPEEGPLTQPTEDDTIKAPEDDTLCPICLGLFYRPVRTICGHVYCRHCIGSWLDNHFRCPLCREVLGPNDLEEHYEPPSSVGPFTPDTSSPRVSNHRSSPSPSPSQSPDLPLASSFFNRPAPSAAPAGPSRPFYTYVLGRGRVEGSAIKQEGVSVKQEEPSIKPEPDAGSSQSSQRRKTRVRPGQSSHNAIMIDSDEDRPNSTTINHSIVNNTINNHGEMRINEPSATSASRPKKAPPKPQPAPRPKTPPAAGPLSNAPSSAPAKIPASRFSTLDIPAYKPRTRRVPDEAASAAVAGPSQPPDAEAAGLSTQPQPRTTSPEPVPPRLTQGRQVSNANRMYPALRRRKKWLVTGALLTNIPEETEELLSLHFNQASSHSTRIPSPIGVTETSQPASLEASLPRRTRGRKRAGSPSKRASSPSASNTVTRERGKRGRFVKKNKN